MLTIGAPTSFQKGAPDAWVFLCLGLLWMPALEFLPEDHAAPEIPHARPPRFIHPVHLFRGVERELALRALVLTSIKRNKG